MELRLLLKCVHDRGHDKEESIRPGSVDGETAGSTSLIPGRRASGLGVWMGRLWGALT